MVRPVNVPTAFETCVGCCRCWEQNASSQNKPDRDDVCVAVGAGSKHTSSQNCSSSKPDFGATLKKPFSEKEGDDVVKVLQKAVAEAERQLFFKKSV